jgi:hypothetical protein
MTLNDTWERMEEVADMMGGDRTLAQQIIRQAAEGRGELPPPAAAAAVE